MRVPAKLDPVYVGETVTLLLTVTDVDSDSALDLSVFSEITCEVKTAPGAADPALISKTMTGGGIVPKAQSGATLGQATITIDNDDTTTVNALWPAAPDNVGTFWLDVWGVEGGEPKVLVPPSPLVVRTPVNLP